jgi:putative membrane protein
MTAQDFVSEAASSDMFEIRSSEAALERAQSEEVRAFADMMIADHTQASENLMAAAEAAGAAVPAEMLEKHRVQVEQLEPLEGEAFDEAYIQAQLTAHEEALALMQNYAEAGDQEALREHAAATAPVIEGHLQHVRQLAGN